VNAGAWKGSGAVRKKSSSGLLGSGAAVIAVICHACKGGGWGACITIGVHREALARHMNSHVP
jgi:hypothetical protein